MLVRGVLLFAPPPSIVAQVPDAPTPSLPALFVHCREPGRTSGYRYGFGYEHKSLAAFDTKGS